MYKVLCILFLSLSLYSTVNAQNSFIEGISYPYLEKLVKIAKENYPRVKANEERISIAQNNLQKARISWLDVLGLYYFYSPQRSSADVTNPYFLNGAQVGFSLNLGAFLQKPATIKNSKKEVEIAVSQKTEYELNLEANVKDRYFTYLQKRSLLNLHTQGVLDAQSTSVSIRSKFERGQESLENYNRSLALLTEQKRAQIIAESEMLSAKAFLEELLNKKLEEIN